PYFFYLIYFVIYLILTPDNKVYIKAVDYEGNPISTSVQVKVNRQNWTGYKQANAKSCVFE
ncbi:MAG: hypothetical protein ACE5J3_12725, partial [Methanosarcinales archaeon]